MFSSQVCKWPPETLLGARPFGPLFHQVSSVSLPQDAWGPIPVHHRVCFCLCFGVTHEISFAKKGFHCFKKCLWRPHNRGCSFRSSVQTLKSHLKLLTLEEKNLHQEMQRPHAQEAPGPTWIAGQLALISSAPFPAVWAQPGLSSSPSLQWT